MLHLYDSVLYITGACIGLFGICGNLAALCAFQKQSKKTSTSFLFQALAITDSCVLLTVCSWQLLRVCHFYFLGGDIITLIMIIFDLGELAVLLSYGVTVVLTITQFIAVCFPLHASKLCSISRVYRYLIATIIISIGLRMPLSLTYWCPF